MLELFFQNQIKLWSNPKVLLHDLLSFKEYDRQNRQPSQKKLLPSPTAKNGAAMVQNPVSDIFLCDKCDDEFSTLKEVQTHEKQCAGDRPQSPKMPSPEPEIFEDEADLVQQVPFLSYLGLEPGKHTELQPYRSPKKKSFVTDSKYFGKNYLPFESVDISSPLGKAIIQKARFAGRYQVSQSNVIKYERHVYASPDPDSMPIRESSRALNRWVTVWRPTKAHYWTHKYCFTSAQRKERLHTIHNGLDKDSRKLLTKCKGVKVKLKRLLKQTIRRATRRRIITKKSAPCIDLTDEVVVVYNQNEGVPTVSVPQIPSTSDNLMFQHSLFGSQNFSQTNGVSNDFVAPGTLLYNESNNEWVHNLSSWGVSVKPLQEESLISDSCPEDPLGFASELRGSKRPSVESVDLNNPHKRKKIENNSNNNSLIDSGTPSKPIDYIEVIDLSSDDDLEEINGSVHASSNSIPYSKNGYSHWSPGKLLLLDALRRRKGLVANGNPVNYSVHHNKPSFIHSSRTQPSIDNKLKYLKELCDEIEDITSDGRSSSTKDCRMHCGTIKVLKRKKRTSEDSVIVDDEITFNNKVLRDSVIRDPSPTDSSVDNSESKKGSSVDNSESKKRSSLDISESKKRLKLDDDEIPKKVDVPSSDTKNNSMNKSDKFSSDFLSNMKATVNNSLKYISSMVKSSFYKPATDISLDVKSKKLKNNKVNGKINKKLKGETLRLMGDECRELNLKGMSALHTFSSKGIATRCTASKLINSIKTRRSTFIIKGTKKPAYTKRLTKLSNNISKPPEEKINLIHDRMISAQTDGSRRSQTIFDENGNSSRVENLSSSELNDNICKKLNSINYLAPNLFYKNSITVDKNFASFLPFVSKSGSAEKIRLKRINVRKCSTESDNSSSTSSEDNRSNRIAKSKKHSLARELLNLVNDECKELKDLGFHPTDILGNPCSGGIPLINQNPFPETPTFPFARKNSLISYKKCSPPKKICMSSANNLSFTGQGGVKLMLEHNKKLSRELSKLMKDEWKELKKCGSHPSQLPQLLSNQRNLRSINVGVGSYKNNRMFSGRKERFQELSSFNSDDGISEWCLSRSTRGQSKMPVVERETCRMIHRNLIQSEDGMCVVNYDINSP